MSTCLNKKKYFDVKKKVGGNLLFRSTQVLLVKNMLFYVIVIAPEVNGHLLVLVDLI